MTALSAARNTTKLVGDPIPVRVGRGMAVDIGYKGGMAAINAAGYLAPAGVAASDIVVGRFVDTYDNSAGNAGDINGEAEQGAFWWANGDAIAITDLGKACYASDDQTVTLSSNGGARPFAGVIVDIDTSLGVCVLQGFALRGLDVAPPGQITVVSLDVGFADCTDADQQQTFDFAAALPANAMVVGAGANVTAIFDNVGDTASLTFDLGIKSGDTDGFIDGGSLDAVAKVSVPRGVAIPGLVGAITPSVIIDSSVNLNTLTKGAATFYVAYVAAF